MVWFWGSSGDAGSVWFYPRETSNPPYASRVNTTSPESYHTSPEEENPSGEVKYLELVLVGLPTSGLATWWAILRWAILTHISHQDCPPQL